MAPILTLALTAARPAAAQTDASLSPTDLDRLPIEDLAKIEISSVSKSVEPLSDAPAAIYVISHEDIVRSGATSLPEILRLAPNLQVEQVSASRYVITARGMNGNPAAQSFSDKLLVLIDGRSVYTPLYSGVYWDMQDVLPEDIDRIEVISGPGATLWGANAVNGVVNIITRKSSETQGGLVQVSAGNLEDSISLRYGGRISDDLTYRFYVKDFLDQDTTTATGANAHDQWYKPQGGFRLDWSPSSSDTATVQGDAYQGDEAQAGAPDTEVFGEDLLGRWNHAWQGGSALQVQAYYDRTERLTDDSGGYFELNTLDLDVQHSFGVGARNAIVWGGGLRVNQYHIDGTATFFFQPPSRTLNLADIFAQDTVSISDGVKLVLGAKLEGDPYIGTTVLPNGRLSWKIGETALLWGAVSQAIRSPTPFDRDVKETNNGSLFASGGPGFQSEKLTAYEAGVRVQPTASTSFSISTFYNVYDDLRTVELNFVIAPLIWGNKLHGDSYGIEAWGDYRVSSWWRLSAGFNALTEQFKFKAGATGLFAAFLRHPELGLQQLGDDPHYQASLRSSMNLGPAVTLDADLRYVDALPAPSVPSYVELNGRIGWRVSPRVQLSLAGFNLLHDHHQELPAVDDGGNVYADRVSRSFMAGVQCRF